ncbi:unnamed protein product [Lymnaea stagnalis]|uniref:Uncharacterized protein n=1 Tax=Lymnaea stagnalis TaxID=6523 RepID=A0AAV2HS28_LYMST
MATLLDIKSLVNSKTETCHFLPCEIDFDGGAKVSSFFIKTVSQEFSHEKHISATFRGRPLKGEEVELPTGYTGLVVKEHHKRSTEDEDRNLAAIHRFDKFTHWNLDKTPTPDDSIHRALQWVDISAALYGRSKALTLTMHTACWILQWICQD